MSATEPRTNPAAEGQEIGTIEMKLRARVAAGRRLRHQRQHPRGPVHPPSSNASVAFGTGLTPAEPGSAQGLELVVSDINAARENLIARGAEVSELFHLGDTGISRVRTPSVAGIRPTPRLATRMATGGCCRRSRRVVRDD